jgi:hypothetical protein
MSCSLVTTTRSSGPDTILGTPNACQVEVPFYAGSPTEKSGFQGSRRTLNESLTAKEPYLRPAPNSPQYMPEMEAMLSYFDRSAFRLTEDHSTRVR